MSDGAKVVVTGSSGFIGRSLVPLLVDLGCEVETVGRDAGADPRRIVERVTSCQPDVVIHLATRFVAGHEVEDIPDLVRSNVEFGTCVAEGAARTRARFVNIGTAWQHYLGSAYSPISLYAASKQALATILEYYSQVHDLRWSEVTLFDTYGPGDDRPKLVPSLLAAAATGDALDLSDGYQLIDLTYVDDIVRGIALVALDPDGSASCVLRSWSPVTIRDLVTAVETAIELPVPVVWGAREPRLREMRTDWVFGESPAGWQPAVPLLEGIRRTWREVPGPDGSR